MPDPLAPLNAEITVLGAAANALGVDVPAAIKRVKDETNLTTGALLVGGTLKGVAGTTVAWPITLIPSTTLPTALQADIVLPSGITFVSVTAGVAATNAGKQVQASVVNGNERFLIFGLNQTVMAQGIVATVQLAIATGLKGLFPVCLIAPSLSDGNGNEIQMSTISGTVSL
jgi:hypothetical protein